MSRADKERQCFEAMDKALKALDAHINIAGMHPDIATGLRHLHDFGDAFLKLAGFRPTDAEREERAKREEAAKARQAEEEAAEAKAAEEEAQKHDTDAAIKSLADSFDSEEQATGAAAEMTAKYTKAEVPLVLSAALARVKHETGSGTQTAPV